MAATLTPAILLGIAGPLAAAVATWFAVDRTYRKDPLRVTGVLLWAWGAKVVFFVAYVVVAVKGLEVHATAFAITLAAALVLSYGVEALLLRQLFSRAWRGVR
jgi:hypothetical protein